MDKALEAIKTAWDPGDPHDKNVDSKRDEDKTRSLSDKYVADNPDKFAGFEHISQEVLVRMLEDAREKGDSDEEWKIQAWLFHHFEPQQIGVQVSAQIRLPNG